MAKKGAQGAGKSKAKAKAEAAQAAQARAPAQAEAPAQVGDVFNGDWFVKIKSFINEIAAHDAFQGVFELPPMNLADGARQAPFDSVSFGTALKASGEYTCGGNFWWQNFSDDAGRKSFPLNPKRIESIIEHYFSVPAPMPDAVVIGTKTDAPITEGKVNFFQVLSPIEFSHAFIVAVHRSLSKNDPAALDGWRTAMLNTPFKIRVCANKNTAHFASKQIRQDMGAPADFCIQPQGETAQMRAIAFMPALLCVALRFIHLRCLPLLCNRPADSKKTSEGEIRGTVATSRREIRGTRGTGRGAIRGTRKPGESEIRRPMANGECETRGAKKTSKGQTRGTANTSKHENRRTRTASNGDT